MNLAEIEHNVAELDYSKGFDLIYDLLRAYGLPKASITRLQKGTYNRSDTDNERLWKGKLYYRCLAGPDEDLHAAIDEAKNDERIMRERPRFLVIRDDDSLVAVDTRTEDTLDCMLTELPSHTAFFLPWAGIEKTQLESLNVADRKAAEKMAKLYDEIVKHNAIEDETDVRNLNIFFSRLLFCFFAEDTRVFSKGSFTNAIASLTKADGSDTGPFLDQLFKVLDTEPSKRQGLASHFLGFDYVNGRLFAAQAPSPQFSSRARNLVLDCGTLDWSQINPDIFGSMIQAVVHPSQREGLGMHYTSVENIMKVIRPLFLDELHEAFDATDTVGKLEKLLDRIAAIKVFDPACGSGNFLVIAYKELRKLEHRILLRLEELDPNKAGLFQLSRIQLDHFYGIEIDDFAHEVAILSLWLAKHQMNVEFHEMFGVEISLIPLKDTGNVVCGNAARLEWETVCPPANEVYVLGNPPYRGAALQDQEHKRDMVLAFDGASFDASLDYVAAWYYKGSRYVAGSGATMAFVSTNSVCQGSQVAALWPLILAMGVHISFAHTSFRWTNKAKGNAGVTVAVVGLTATKPKRCLLYDGSSVRTVSEISPYLTASRRDLVVRGRSRSERLPEMTKGNGPTDGGNLLLDPAERDSLLSRYPEAASFVRRYMGASEFIRGTERYCIWVPENRSAEASEIPGLQERFERVRAFRSASKKVATKKWADRPWSFVENRHKDGPSIIIPRHSSERRRYIPMGFLDENTIISDAANAIYGAEPWIFGLLQSRMHMVWVDAIGGRLKTDYRYSAVLCYNPFPVPALSQAARDLLTDAVFGLLEARERHSHQTLAQLYDPDKMPTDLALAHERTDEVVDQLYGRTFQYDEHRLARLLEQYEGIASESEVLLHA